MKEPMLFSVPFCNRQRTVLSTNTKKGEGDTYKTPVQTWESYCRHL